MKDAWIGLICVSARVIEVLDGASGAYVCMLTIVTNETEFKKKASEACNQYGLDLEDVLWCSRLVERLASHGVENYVMHIAEDVLETGKTMFGLFHTWEHD